MCTFGKLSNLLLPRGTATTDDNTATFDKMQ